MIDEFLDEQGFLKCKCDSTCELKFSKKSREPLPPEARNISLLLHLKISSFPSTADDQNEVSERIFVCSAPEYIDIDTFRKEKIIARKIFLFSALRGLIACPNMYASKKEKCDFRIYCTEESLITLSDKKGICIIIQIFKLF